jgi:hypothetical protein
VAIFGIRSFMVSASAVAPANVAAILSANAAEQHPR